MSVLCLPRSLNLVNGVLAKSVWANRKSADLSEQGFLSKKSIEVKNSSVYFKGSSIEQRH